MSAIPHISLNKLAEFAHATESKKRALIKSFNDPEIGDQSRRQIYKSASSAIISYMIDKDHDSAFLEEKKKNLINEKTESNNRKRNITNCVAAIDHFLNISKKELNQYLKFTSKRGLPRQHRQLTTNGVQVYLTPEVSFWHKNDKIAGVMKLVFLKSRKLTPMEGEIIAGLLHRTIKRIYKTDIQQKDCIVIDIFARRIFVAPDSFNYHSRVLKKAFQEINKLWKR